MKLNKIIVLALAIAAMASCGPKFEGSKETLALLPSNGQVDSASYLIGVNFGMWMKGNDFGPMNYSLIVKGMKDAINAKGDPRDSTFAEQFKINPELMNDILENFVQARRDYTAALNTEKGAEYIAEFEKKEGVVKTESGLCYRIYDEGNDIIPSEKDTVWCDYKGTLIDGTVFDENENIRFMLNRVVKGWTEGLQLIGEGGKIELVIPGDLAYGERGTRGIAPNSVLHFDITLNKVGKVAEQAEEK